MSVDWEERARSAAASAALMLDAVLAYEYEELPIKETLLRCHDAYGQFEQGGQRFELCENFECGKHGWPEEGEAFEVEGMRYWLCSECAGTPAPYVPTFVPGDAA